MYPPAYFSDTGLAAALEVARETRFAPIVTIDDGVVLPVHLPITLLPGDGWQQDDRPEFVGHVITANPLYALLEEGEVAGTIIFQPADGYVSPGIYDEKRRSGRVVPTWNYVAAHFEAVLRPARGDGALERILRAQIADYEGAVGGTWRLDDAPADYIERMASAIAGFTAVATGWKTICKLSQNRPDERPNVIRWLDDNASPASSIGYWMRKV